MRINLINLGIILLFLAISIWQTFKIQFIGGKIVFIVFDIILLIVFIVMLINTLKNTT